MICIIKTDSQFFSGSLKEAVKGWIIATDIDDARRQAQGAMDNDLAGELYRMTFPPAPGKYALGSYLMLVS